MNENKEREAKKVTHLDQILAVPMFAVSSLFLMATGAFLHLIEGDVFSPLASRLLVFMGLLYLFIVGEAIAHWKVGSNNLRQHIWFLLMPILRLCPRDHVDGSRAWIAGLGWRETTPRLQRYLARIFSAPMIVIALLVLPVVAVEFLYADYIAVSSFRRLVISSTSAFIWMAFVYEFVVMVSIVQKRVRYCKRNWIDVAVVLLPLVSFMGMARLGRLVKLKQLSRTAKIYRMRGLAIRSWRAIVALDVVDTLLRKSPEDKIDRLLNQILEKEEEIGELKNELDRIRQKAEPKKGASIGLNLKSQALSVKNKERVGPSQSNDRPEETEADSDSSAEDSEEGRASCAPVEERLETAVVAVGA